MGNRYQQRDAIDRFVEKIDFTDGCWIWTGASTKEGYGSFRGSNRALEYAHRFAWKTFVGPIPEGTELDHVRKAGCQTRACVNPDHLEPVTHLENIRRGPVASRETCSNGHPYTPENTRLSREGWRACRACRRRYQADRYKKAKGAA